ncbi:hypothetical protein [Streptomyces sp. NK08204]|uniref:hypothetical protein n=1 Tax=Streptomyces sp. NK08204 TaxID=2873260 RepID=UPI001CEC8CDF|nr:hypothetical protein [Streptomyces sp. NK08204]
MRQGPHAPGLQPVPALSRRRPRARRAVVALALAGATAVSVWLGQQAWSLWEGTPFPVTDPAATAQRLDEDTQQAYDALGLPDARLDTEWSDSGRTAEEGSCSYRGLNHLEDQLSDSPPSVPGVVVVRTVWALKGVPAQTGQAALRRARSALRRKGWHVTTYTAADKDIDLSATPPDGGATVRLVTYPRDRLEVSASADCARVPQGTAVDETGEVPLPPQQLPWQLSGFRHSRQTSH